MAFPYDERDPYEGSDEPIIDTGGFLSEFAAKAKVTHQKNLAAIAAMPAGPAKTKALAQQKEWDRQAQITISRPGKKGGPFRGVGKALGKVAKVAFAPVTLTNKLAAATLGKIPVLGQVVTATNRLAALPISVTQNLLDGGNFNRVVLGEFKQALADVKTVGPWIQTVISFVPGIGTGVAAAIAAGLALAEGKSISEAMIAGVKGALPGGAVTQAAFNVAQAAIERKPIDQIAISALPISDQQKKMLSQGLQAVKDIASGKNVAKSIVDNAIKALPPEYAKAVQVGMAVGHAKSLQEAVKIVGKEAVSVGASALAKSAPVKNLIQSGAKTVNPFIKAAGAIGSSKGGIQKAIGAAQAIRNGSPALKSALNSAVSNFQSGSPQHLGFVTAVATLKQTTGNKNALALARRALPPAAQHGFDVAMGTVSHAVSVNPGALGKRAGSVFTPQLSRGVPKISPHAPNLAHAIQALTRNPTLANSHPMVLANKFGTTQQVVLQALQQVGTKRLLPWRSLSPRAAQFIRRWHPNAPIAALTHGSSDTSGLDETGTKYIVVKGDNPWKIATLLTGNGARWTELKALNKDKKPTIDKNVWVGEVLNIPASWQKPTAKPAPAPVIAALPSQPAPQAPTVSIPVPQQQHSTAPGTLQAKSILVAWSKTDGVNQAGVTDYGSNVADMSTDWTSRDSTQLMSFQNWNNKAGNTKLDVDGILGPKSLSALQSWAEARATQSVPIVASGGVTTLPEIVIEASAPIVSPGIPQLPPAPTPAAVVVATPAPTPVAPPVAPAAKGGSLAPALAGAAIGGTIFGLPGAILGGVAGAAMA